MKYIALLRGINVSGKKIIKMADLKSLFEHQGFKNVLTYIQSGNVIFEYEATDQNKLRKKIEKFIEIKYKFHVPVTIRTHSELKKVIKNCPYQPVNLDKDGTKILVSFLLSKPESENIEVVKTLVTEPEKIVFSDFEVYLYCPNGYGKSKITNNFLEKKLQLNATTRNWKSVLKLTELSENE